MSRIFCRPAKISDISLFSGKVMSIVQVILGMSLSKQFLGHESCPFDLSHSHSALQK